MSKSSIAKKAAGVLAAAAAVPALFAATAHADTTGTLYFSASGLNCSIAANGDVGCDSPSARPMQITYMGLTIPVPFYVNQVVIDAPWAPAHPGSAEHRTPSREETRTSETSATRQGPAQRPAQASTTRGRAARQGSTAASVARPRATRSATTRCSARADALGDHEQIAETHSVFASVSS